LLWDCAHAYAGLTKIRTKAVILRDLAFCRGRRKQEGLQNSDASSQTIVSKGPDIIMSEYPQEVEARHGETTESVRTKQDVDVVMTDNASKGASTTMVASKPENFDADTISPVHTSHVNAVAAAVTAALPDIQQDYEISAQVVANKEGGEQRSSDMPDVSRTAIVDRSTSPSKQSKPPKSIAHDSSDGSDEHIYKDASRADHPPPGDATTFATDRLLGMAQSEFAYTDVNSLLPGLEIYANGNGDAAFDGMDYMANLSTSNTRTRQDAAAETRFDDVFSFGDFTGEGPEQGGLDTQFDEEFFNLDNS